MYGKEGTGRNESNTKKYKTKKHREMGRDGVKEMEGVEEDSETDNEKGICFHSRSAGS